MALPLRSAIRDADPGYFALVMATGIVSRALALDNAGLLADVLLGLGIAAYLVIAGIYAGRLLAWRQQVRADARDPRRAFGFFTLAAGSDVLSALLGGDGDVVAAAILLAIGAASWALLSYAVPLLLASAADGRMPLAAANGTWFLWPVATQSVAVGLLSQPRPVPAAAAALAVCCWAVGVVGYLILATLIAGAMLAFRVRPAELTPAYWVFMGATAISVLAGAQILLLPASPLTVAVHAVVSGLSVVLWAFGTWLIPLLVILGFWRHVLSRVPLGYEPGLWSIVFPAGMYGVASHELGAALHVSWLVTLGTDEAWVAFALWALVLMAMVRAYGRVEGWFRGTGGVLPSRV